LKQALLRPHPRPQSGRKAGKRNTFADGDNEMGPFSARQSESWAPLRHRHICGRPQSEGRREIAPQSADALRAYEKDRALRSAMGEPFSASYLKMRQQEWNAYASHFTQWERDHTLDI